MSHPIVTQVGSALARHMRNRAPCSMVMTAPKAAGAARLLLGAFGGSLLD